MAEEARGCKLCEGWEKLGCDMGQDADKTGEPPVQWIVVSASSEGDLHPAANVLERGVDMPWLTQTPTDDAWLVLEPRPPTAFTRVEIVNAGSALVEIHGLRDDADGDADGDYELLLSAQQVIPSFSREHCMIMHRSLIPCHFLSC